VAGAPLLDEKKSAKLLRKPSSKPSFDPLFEKTTPSFEHKTLGFELLETGLSEKRTAGALASRGVDLLIAVRNSK
jgi:hypothetical protein